MLANLGVDCAELQLVQSIGFLLLDEAGDCIDLLLLLAVESVKGSNFAMSSL